MDALKSRRSGGCRRISIFAMALKTDDRIVRLIATKKKDHVIEMKDQIVENHFMARGNVA